MRSLLAKPIKAHCLVIRTTLAAIASDVILGTSGNDNIWAGTQGNDLIDAGAGADFVGIGSGKRSGAYWRWR